MANLRVLIADDHEFVRKGVRALLELSRKYDVCFEAVNGQEAYQKALELKPDVAILDVTMPLLSGFDAARKIRQSNPGILILILSMHKSTQFIQEAKSLGVAGYVSKSEAGLTLIDAIDSAVQGKPFYPAEE